MDSTTKRGMGAVVLAVVAAVSILMLALGGTASVSAGGGEGEAHAGKRVFDASFRIEVEPIEVRIVRGFPGQIKPGETAEMWLAIKNHSPSTDWVVAMEAEIDLSNVALHSLGLGMEAGMFHGDSRAVYHPGDPLVIPAGATKEIGIVVTAHNGAGMVLVKNVSVYRLRPFVDGLG